MSKDMKICVECKHYEAVGLTNSAPAHYCVSPDNGLCRPAFLDVVTGIKFAGKAGRALCYELRDNDQKCGPEGKLWEPKD